MARNSKVWLLRECSRMGLMGPGRVLSFSPAVFFSYWEGHSQRGTRIRPSKMQGSGQGPLLLFFWHFPHYCLSYAFFFFKCENISCSVVSNSLWPHRLSPTRLLCPRNSPGNNSWVDSHSLLQGIFLTQGSNPSLLHWRQIFYWLSHQGSSPQIF